MPLVVNVGQYGLLVVGTITLLYVVARVSTKLSKSFQPSHKVSRHRKYSNIYPDMIHRFGDVEKVFELNEKLRKNSISRADLLQDAESNSEKKFMLEEEPAISEDEDSENESNSSRDSVSINLHFDSAGFHRWLIFLCKQKLRDSESREINCSRMYPKNTFQTKRQITLFN